MYEYIKKYDKFISCVLFYGGEWDVNALTNLMLIAKSFNKKVALYTGLDLLYVPNGITQQLDYIKTGRYIAKLGGIDSKATNQRFYKKENFGWLDITHEYTK